MEDCQTMLRHPSNIQQDSDCSAATKWESLRILPHICHADLLLCWTLFLISKSRKWEPCRQRKFKISWLWIYFEIKFYSYIMIKRLHIWHKICSGGRAPPPGKIILSMGEWKQYSALSSRTLLWRYLGIFPTGTSHAKFSWTKKSFWSNFNYSQII